MTSAVAVENLRPYSYRKKVNTIERIVIGFIIMVALGSLLGFTAYGADCFIDARSRPLLEYCPASVNNYRTESRTKEEINYIVIHTVQGSTRSAVNTFSSHNLDYPRSAHYTISSSGEVIKSVDPSYIAWHAGTSPIGSGGKYESRVLNENSIGIEHGGYVDDPKFPSKKQYLTSAALTRYLCEKYDIPIDRRHIVGHEEIKSAKGDPGPNWDWDYFMNLVKHGTREVPPATEGSITGSRPQPVQKGPGILSVGLIVVGLTMGVLGFINA